MLCNVSEMSVNSDSMSIPSPMNANVQDIIEVTVINSTEDESHKPDHEYTYTDASKGKCFININKCYEIIIYVINNM